MNRLTHKSLNKQDSLISKNIVKHCAKSQVRGLRLQSERELGLGRRKWHFSAQLFPPMTYDVCNLENPYTQEEMVDFLERTNFT